MSTISFLEEVKRKPLVWSSRAPTVLRPLRSQLQLRQLRVAAHFAEYEGLLCGDGGAVAVLGLSRRVALLELLDEAE